MRRLGAKEERPGWAKAPPIVEAEIRAVWQEDELPDELTQAPGYRPFTLGGEAQEWVDSMAEVVDGGKAVYGRPKPATPTSHRQLATPPTPLPPTPQPTFSPATYRPPPSKPRILMPDIDEAPPPPKPRILMPESGASSPPSKPHVLMPDIDVPPPPPKPRILMPDIDDPSPPPQPHGLMPEINDSPPARPRTLPKRVLMPEIDQEQQPPKQKPPSMPEIG